MVICKEYLTEVQTVEEDIDRQLSSEKKENRNCTIQPQKIS